MKRLIPTLIVAGLTFGLSLLIIDLLDLSSESKSQSEEIFQVATPTKDVATDPETRVDSSLYERNSERTKESGDTEAKADDPEPDSEGPGEATLEDVFSELQRIDLTSIQFSSGGSELSPVSYYELGRLFDFLREHPEASIMVVGHTDSAGSETWNRQLSLSRASSVKEYLMELGIAAERILVNGAGSSDPIRSNDTVEGRSMNRRIEIRLIEPSSQSTN
jgi:outer membrane protein OmpA-like peptidoglycan-associated protein